MTAVRYLQDSRFFAPIEKALDRFQGDWRKPIQVDLGPRGYERVAIVHIRRSDRDTFRTELDFSHPKRFGARLRAAATVLRQRGMFGSYWICHVRGVLLILRIR